MPLHRISISLADSQHCVTASAELNLLDLMHGLQLPVRKACRNGACGVCRCHLRTGTISYGSRQPTALWDRDIAAGYILPCIAHASSDLELDQLTLVSDQRG